ncbi:MAG TPA: acetyl-CoA carboxylase, biotin carboxyl carrier protein, partial [Leptolyngbyaceae cyanobacterium M65_K2018_010]|nr:acetyl-CoA carboxylase, biotin carboxyl carrier protein [Leptolyngbyaceae cyanobacterium M65_K2018_010]
MEFTVNELRELVAALSQSDVAELTLKSSSFELTLRKPSALAAAPSLLTVEASAVAPPPMPVPVPAV